MEPSIETEERLRREAEEARQRAAELQALEAAADAQRAAAAQAALDEAAARERIRQVGGSPTHQEQPCCINLSN